MKYYFTGHWESDNYMMTDILSQIEFFSGSERKKMCKTKPGDGSMLYGYTWKSWMSPTKRRTPSEYIGLCQTKMKDLYPELEDIFKEFASHHFPDFYWTQVQMNKNFKAPHHKDSKNIGESVLCAFGDYAKGRTIVKINKNALVTYDPREKPVKFNGSLYEHWVEDWYGGDRYSLVFYNNLKSLQLK